MKRRAFAMLFLAIALALGIPCPAYAERVAPFDLDKCLSTSGLILHVKFVEKLKVEVLDVLRGKLDGKSLIVPRLDYDGPVKRKFPDETPEGVLFLRGGIDPGLTLGSPAVVLFSNDNTKVYFLTTRDPSPGGHFYLHQPDEGSKDDFLRKLAERIPAEAAERAKLRAAAIARLDTDAPRLAGKGGLEFYATIGDVAKYTLPGDSDGVDALCRCQDGGVIHALVAVNDSEAPAKLLASWGSGVLRYTHSIDYLARDLGFSLLDVLLTAHKGQRKGVNDNLRRAQTIGAVHGLFLLLNRPDLPAATRDKIVIAILESMQDQDARNYIFASCGWRVIDRRILVAMKDYLDTVPKDKKNSNFVNIRRFCEYGIGKAEERLQRIEKGFERLSRTELENLLNNPELMVGKTEAEVQADWGISNNIYTGLWQYYAPAGWFVAVSFRDGRVSHVSVDLYGKLKL